MQEQYWISTDRTITGQKKGLEDQMPTKKNTINSVIGTNIFHKNPSNALYWRSWLQVFLYPKSKALCVRINCPECTWRRKTSVITKLLIMLQLAWNGILWYSSYNWLYHDYNWRKGILHWSLNGHYHAVCDDFLPTWIQSEVKTSNCSCTCSVPLETKPSSCKSHHSSRQPDNSMILSCCLFMFVLLHLISIRI